MAKTSDSWLIAPDPAIELDSVRTALVKVLASSEFVRSERACDFLRYIVEETLAGRGGRLKAFSIATDVYGRDETFNPRTDTIVRVEAGRLRRRLKTYYTTEGQGDPVRIDLPVGGYEPTFEAMGGSESGRTVNPAEIKTPRKATKIPRLFSNNRMFRAVASACLLASVVVVAWFGLFRESPNGPSAIQPKIAVMPFVNATGDPEDAYLADGFTIELVIALARYDHMVIVSRATSAKYDGADPRDIGRDLAAQYVIQGSLQNDGTNLRISSDLTDTNSASVVWAEAFSLPISSEDGFSTATEIASLVAKAVAKPHGVIYQETLVGLLNAPTDFSSYQCILKAYDFDRKRGADYHALVRACLEKTVRHEPDLATAWVLLSSAYLDEYRNSYNPLPEPRERALKAALRAVDLAPKDSQSHWALALVHYFNKDFPAFHESAERALSLGANDADMIANLGFKLIVSGSDWDRGRQLMEQAMEMSPTHPPMWYAPIALYHYHAEDYEAALSAANRFNIPKLYLSHVVQAMTFGQLGRLDEAESAVDEALRLKPSLAEDLRSDLRRRSIPEEMIKQMVDGLKKAGMDVPGK